MRRYWGGGELVVIADFRDPATLALLAEEVDGLQPRIARKWVPGYKRSGSASARALAELAPRMFALYRSPDLLRLVSRIVRTLVTTCPREDLHACALYQYSE